MPLLPARIGQPVVPASVRDPLCPQWRCASTAASCPAGRVFRWPSLGLAAQVLTGPLGRWASTDPECSYRPLRLLHQVTIIPVTAVVPVWKLSNHQLGTDCG